ncbi:MAG: hypothetical protein P8Z30_11915 [Acidobacteriota bacterium]
MEVKRTGPVVLRLRHAIAVASLIGLRGCRFGEQDIEKLGTSVLPNKPGLLLLAEKHPRFDACIVTLSALEHNPAGSGKKIVKHLNSCRVIT